MRATPGIMRISTCAGQASVESAPFSVSVMIVYVVVCTGVAAVVNVVSIMTFETGSYGPVSLCAMLFLALLLTNLTLTGLTRLVGLQSLVGLKTKLATNTA